MLSLRSRMAMVQWSVRSLRGVQTFESITNKQRLVLAPVVLRTGKGNDYFRHKYFEAHSNRCTMYMQHFHAGALQSLKAMLGFSCWSGLAHRLRGQVAAQPFLHGLLPQR